MVVMMCLQFRTSKIGAMEHYIKVLSEQLHERGDHLVVVVNQCSWSLVEYWSSATVHQVVHWRFGVVKALCRLHLPDVVLTHFFSLRSSMAWWLKAIGVSSIVVDDHSSGSWDLDDVRRTRQALYRCTLAPTDAVVSVSDYVRLRHTRRFGLPDEKLHRIYNGVAVHPMVERRGSSVRCVMVGHLIEQKGVDVVLEAYQRLSNVHDHVSLKVIGDGPLRQTLEASVVGRDDIAFLGQRSDVPRWMQWADIAIVPSVWQEAFGYVTAEAMMAGCAVIVTQTGASAELVDNGRCGVLVKPSDVDALYQAWSSLVVNETRRSVLGRRARLRAQKMFSVTRMVEDVVRLCDSISQNRA